MSLLRRRRRGAVEAAGQAAVPAKPPVPPGFGKPGWSAEQSVAPSVRAAAAWSWRFLFIAGAAALVFWLFGFFKLIVVAVSIALLFAVLLAPFARWLRHYLHFPRAAAAATSVLGLLVVVAGLVALAGTSIANGFGDLQEQASKGFDELISWLSDGPFAVSADQLNSLVDQARSALSDNASSVVSGALAITTTVGHVAAGTLIALFCTFFFLLDGLTIWTWLVGLLPVQVRERVHQAGRRGLVTLGGYTRTQILVALVDALGIGAGAAILQVPLAVPLATLVFVGSFIPIVGAVATGAVAVLVALVAQGPVVALIMLGVVLVVQQLEGHVLQPFLMGHAVSLHPVAVLLAVTAGSMSAGIVGALFAVPIAAVLNTVVLYLNGHDKFPNLGTEDHLRLRRPGPWPSRRPARRRPDPTGAVVDPAQDA